MVGWKLQEGFSIGIIFLSCSKLMKFLCFPCGLSTKHEDLLLLYWWCGMNGDRSIVMDGLCRGTKYGLSMVMRDVRRSRSRWLVIGMMEPGNNFFKRIGVQKGKIGMRSYLSILQENFYYILDISYSYTVINMRFAHFECWKKSQFIGSPKLTESHTCLILRFIANFFFQILIVSQ